MGLRDEKPNVTKEETKALVSKFYEEFGRKGLDDLIITSFANSKLTDREAVFRKRALLEEIQELEVKRLEYAIKSKTDEMRTEEEKINAKIKELGNRGGGPEKPAADRRNPAKKKI